MKTTPYAAFGYVILQNTCAPGDVINDEIIKSNTYEAIKPSAFEDGDYSGTSVGCTWLYCVGNLRVVNVDTGYEELRGPGWSNVLEPEAPGRYRIEFLEPFVAYCLSALPNQNRTPRIPRTTYFSLKAGEAATIPVGTKLFLGHGVLRIGDCEFGIAKQLSFSSGNKEVVAETDCYGLIFP